MEVGQKAKNDTATAELFKIKQVNETVDIAPLKIIVKDVKVIKLTDIDPTFAEDIALNADTTSEEIKDGFSYIQC
ncbi:hypothetical protein [Metabacillus hrfriensis]|uniref:Uncharacterized protein n=1 Tax=Metabacillus hrfriensis TaxID=3048891 RepID=A0ACD4RHL3_9BACI|nr:hypothetical protein [Metabacillus sp. CT-WN-B3]WHZ59977.1 hypothetical protein QLQ22_11850 [Metabacillus sp. CT-WN-B3]